MLNTSKEEGFTPLFTSTISAGFGSSADSHIDQKLDLNEHLIPHPSATFFIKVQGNSMQNAGIFSGDLLIVDRSLNAISGNVIVALYQSEFTVKRLKIQDTHIFLIPENPDYKPVEIRQKEEFQIWGVVTHVIHSL